MDTLAFRLPRTSPPVWRQAFHFRRKVSRLRLPKTGGLTAAERSEALKFLGRLVEGYRDLRWHEAYAKATGLHSAEYLPEDVFYALIEPTLNPHDYLHILRDKNNFDLLRGWSHSRPTTIGRLIKRQLFDGEYRPATLTDVVAAALGDDELVVKPSRNSGGGKNVRFCRPDEVETVLRSFTDAIVQRVIPQHPQMAALNPSSTNTVRVVTYRNTRREIEFVSASVRIGRAGSRIDNQTSGGVVCGIHEDGSLRGAAYDRHFNRYDAHPSSSQAFAGHVIPAFRDIVTEAVRAHEQTPWIDMASWDATVDAEGRVIFIEVNSRGQEINFPQLTNGPVYAKIAEDLSRRIGRRRYSTMLGFT